ncbi:MAG TPA: hypothetical protein VMW27_02740 [Thermoanaerobaculia bacterium]|nr:hypothetical protein [Thermoanaerobaculia bacterium]
MLSQNPTEPQASPLSGAEAGTAAAPAPMDPRSPVEVASTGNGTVNDPGGTDDKPPGFGDDDLIGLLG